MKLQAGLLSVLGLLCVAMLAAMNLRKKEEPKTRGAVEFQQVKLNVMKDILSENQHQLVQTQSLLDKTKAQLKNLGSEVSNLVANKESLNKQMQTCKREKKIISDKVAAIRSQHSNQLVSFKKEKADWKVEMNSLQQQMIQKSAVCNFVKKNNAKARALCGNEAPEENHKENLPMKEKQEKPVETEI